MSYSDYGAFVYCNGKRREDKEDVAAFATDEETFGTSSENVPSGMRIWLYLFKNGSDGDWINHIHHGILGDNAVRVVCHKQGLPEIYEATENGINKIEYCDKETDWFDYGTVNFEYKGYSFTFKSGKPYCAFMKEPNGDEWECTYDYGYGAGFENEERNFSEGG